MGVDDLHMRCVGDAHACVACALAEIGVLDIHPVVPGPAADAVEIGAIDQQERAGDPVAIHERLMIGPGIRFAPGAQESCQEFQHLALVEQSGKLVENFLRPAVGAHLFWRQQADVGVRRLFGDQRADLVDRRDDVRVHEQQLSAGRPFDADVTPHAEAAVLRIADHLYPGITVLISRQLCRVRLVVDDDELPVRGEAIGQHVQGLLDMLPGLVIDDDDREIHVGSAAGPRQRDRK